jgi:hypothetical protein
VSHIRKGEWRDWEFMLAIQAENFAAGHEHGQLRRCAQQVGDHFVSDGDTVSDEIMHS